MAVRFHGASSTALTSSTGTIPDSGTGCTVLCWGKISLDRQNFSTFWSDDPGVNLSNIIQVNDSRVLDLFRGGQGVPSSLTMEVGEWYKIAVTIDTDDNATLYYAPEGGTPLVVGLTISGEPASTPTTLRIGDDTFNEPLDGCVTNFKMYSTVLSLPEMETELSVKDAVRTANLVRHYRFDTNSGTDSSGNGLHLSGGSGTDTEADPQTLISSATPALILNIGPGANQNHFSVQIAEEGASDTDTYTQSDIAAGLDLDPYFTVNSSGDAVQFNAPADGPKTSGGAGARAELREANQDGTDIAFDPFDGSEHVLSGTSKITHHPVSGTDIDGIGIVLAQLHNGGKDRVAFRTQFVSGSLRLRVRVNGNSIRTGTDATTGTLDIVSGTDSQGANVVNVEFPWKIRVFGGDGSSCTVEFYVNDMETPWATRTDMNSDGATSEGWYFKAGCYNNFDTSNVSASEFGQVELKNLSVFHSLPPVLASTLTDDFEDGILNSPPWKSQVGGSESGGHAVITPPAVSGDTDGFNFIASDSIYTLADNAIFCRLFPATAPGDATLCASRITFYENTQYQNWVALGYNAGSNVLEARGSGLDQDFSYDPVQHRWVRIRESGGTLFFEASADGNTWNVLTSGPTDPGILATHVGEIDLEAINDSPTTAVSFEFDNFNIVPSGIVQPASQFMLFFT